MLEEKLFWVREVEIKPPEKAIIYSTPICYKCWEGFMESLRRVKNGKIVCIPCFEAKDERRPGENSLNNKNDPDNLNSFSELSRSRISARNA